MNKHYIESVDGSLGQLIDLKIRYSDAVKLYHLSWPSANFQNSLNTFESNVSFLGFPCKKLQFSSLQCLKITIRLWFLSCHIRNDKFEKLFAWLIEKLVAVF